MKRNYSLKPTTFDSSDCCEICCDSHPTTPNRASLFGGYAFVIHRQVSITHHQFPIFVSHQFHVASIRNVIHSAPLTPSVFVQKKTARLDESNRAVSVLQSVCVARYFPLTAAMTSALVTGFSGFGG